MDIKEKIKTVINNKKNNIYKALNNKYITNSLRTYYLGQIEMLKELNDIMIKLLDEYYK